MKRILLFLAMFVVSTYAYPQEKSDSELRAGIEKHPWYSSRHEYRFLDSGVILVDGQPTYQTWRIQDGLLYRTWQFQEDPNESELGLVQILPIDSIKPSPKNDAVYRPSDITDPSR